MSSLFLKNNFTEVPNNDDRSNRNDRRSDERTSVERYNIAERNSIASSLGHPPSSGPVFAPPRGAQGLAPFCGTIYDTRMSGNHLEGIHIEPVLAIDSKSRNHSKYPNPNFYDLQLKTTYKDVTKVELKFAQIPNSGYVINKANNLFYFQDRREQVKQCKYYQVEIPCGDWPAENAEGPSLSSILEEELNHASRSYGHRKDCNVSSSVGYNACVCNCSTSIAANPGSLSKSRAKLHGLKGKSNLKRGDETESNCSDLGDSDSRNRGRCDDGCDPSSKYSVTFCKYRRKFTIKQISGSGLFNIIFCGGLTKVGEQGTVTHPIMGVDRFLSPEVPVNEFEKRYINRSIGPILGFCPRNLLDRLEYTSDGVMNFDRDRYVILRIPGFERLQSNWDPLQGAFAIIAATRVANDFIFAKWDQDPFNSETYTKYFNPPLPNLSKIRIEFFNSNGEPFDFNGIDHLLLFDIGSLTQQTLFPTIPDPGLAGQC